MALEELIFIMVAVFIAILLGLTFWALYEAGKLKDTVDAQLLIIGVLEHKIRRLEK